MSAAGPELVPAARGEHPGWLEGVFGGGLGIDGDSYLPLERLAFVLYVLVLVLAAAIAPRLLWAGAIGSVAAFVLAPPLLSLDLFSYASYARLEALHGLNPYSHSPLDLPPGDRAAALVQDQRDVVSAYGPLFTLGTTPLAHLGLPGFAWVLKGLTGLAVIAIAWLSARMASARGLDPRPALALVALNPLVLVHVVGGGHNDALMALALTAGLAAVIAGRELSGGLGLVTAAGIKTSAAFALPFALLEGRRRPPLATGVLAGVAALLLLGLAFYGDSVHAAITIAQSNQDVGSYASLPNTLARDLDISPELTRTVAACLYAAAVAGLLLWTWRGADWIRAAGWAALGLLLASSYVTPWYAILPLPLAAIARDRLLVVGSVLATAFLLRHQVPG
jgi:alpha-1,6-mannosyltransferase